MMPWNQWFHQTAKKRHYFDTTNYYIDGTMGCIEHHLNAQLPFLDLLYNANATLKWNQLYIIGDLSYGNPFLLIYFLIFYYCLPYHMQTLKCAAQCYNCRVNVRGIGLVIRCDALDGTQTKKKKRQCIDW